MLEKEVIKVLEYKINVFQELKSLGITTTTAKRTGLFSQSVMKKFKNSELRRLWMKAKSNNYRGKVDISVSQNFITSKNTIYKL